MFSFSTCPFCVRAKALLDELGAEYEVLELNQMGPEGMQLRAELAEARGAEGGGTGYACAWAAATGRGHAPPPVCTHRRPHTRMLRRLPHPLAPADDGPHLYAFHLDLRRVPCLLLAVIVMFRVACRAARAAHPLAWHRLHGRA